MGDAVMGPGGLAVSFGRLVTSALSAAPVPPALALPADGARLKPVECHGMNPLLSLLQLKLALLPRGSHQCGNAHHLCLSLSPPWMAIGCTHSLVHLPRRLCASNPSLSLTAGWSERTLAACPNSGPGWLCCLIERDDRLLRPNLDP